MTLETQNNILHNYHAALSFGEEDQWQGVSHFSFFLLLPLMELEEEEDQFFKGSCTTYVSSMYIYIKLSKSCQEYCPRRFRLSCVLSNGQGQPVHKENSLAILKDQVKLRGEALL